MNPDTDIDTLKAIRARADAATAGPWLFGAESGQCFVYREQDSLEIPGLPNCDIYQDSVETIRNLSFIAHARTDIPFLLDALATARAQAAAAQATIEYGGEQLRKQDAKVVELLGQLTAAQERAERLVELLGGAIKWLRRLRDRRPELPESFFDDCDPAPLVASISAVLTSPQGTGGGYNMSDAISDWHGAPASDYRPAPTERVEGKE